MMAPASDAVVSDLPTVMVPVTKISASASSQSDVAARLRSGDDGAWAGRGLSGAADRNAPYGREFSGRDADGLPKRVPRVSHKQGSAAHIRMTILHIGGLDGGASRRKLARGDRRLRSCTGKIQVVFGCSFRRGGSSVQLTIRPDPRDANTAPRIPLLPRRDFSA